MLQSTNDRDRDQSFAMKIENVKEGEVKATAVSYPDITATAATHRAAVAKLNQELQSRHRAGKLKR